jgi:hypothetical protein
VLSFSFLSGWTILSLLDEGFLFPWLGSFLCHRLRDFLIGVPPEASPSPLLTNLYGIPTSTYAHSWYSLTLKELTLPNFYSRLIAAFFLGWLFFYCAQCLASRITTRFIRPVASRLFPTSSASPVDIEHNSNVHEKGRKLSLTNDMPVPSTQSLPAQDTHPILISALFLCFAFASIAHIASLVGFDIKGSGSGCGTVPSSLRMLDILLILGHSVPGGLGYDVS